MFKKGTIVITRSVGIIISLILSLIRSLRMGLVMT